MEPADLLILTAEKLEELQLSYFVTGSMATIAYGEHATRTTLMWALNCRSKMLLRFARVFPPQIST